jgi:hypothetical protein
LRVAISTAIERLQGLLDSFVQTTHLGNIQLEGHTAVGRSSLCVPESGGAGDEASVTGSSAY